MLNFFEKIADWLGKLNATIARAGCNMAAVLLAFMVTIVLAQVFFRYVLNDAFGWSEEIAKVMMVWVTFLVSPWAYRYGAFVSVDMFIEPFSEKFRVWLGLFINLLVLWALYVFLIEGIDFWQRGKATLAATLTIELAWFYSIVPISFLALILVGLEINLRHIMTLIDSDKSYLNSEGNS